MGTTMHSPWDDYLEALSLRGDIERPYLTIRQASRNQWQLPSGNTPHPWSSLQPPSSLQPAERPITARVLPVESFSSYNSRYAYGENDGAMWQGRGLNSRLRLGASAEWQYRDHGIGFTLYPTFWAAENRDFELVDPDDLLSVPRLFGHPEFGYITNHMDLPQRMGPDPLQELGWGETELRYDYRQFTTGFGTQSLWLGPGRYNALILSTNAEGFPKLDVGFRKTETRFGAFEGLGFWGRLTPSDYFDTTRFDDHNFYSGMAIAWQPWFWRQFTLGFNKVSIVRWEDFGVQSVIQPFDLSLSGYPGDGGQQASLTGEFRSTETGTSIYLEWARYDYSPRRHLMTTPGWTATWTLGGRQVFSLDPNRFILLSVEHTNLSRSREQMLGPGTWGTSGFYRQHNVGTGFTNRGQVLGGWIGPGADTQYVSLKYYDQFGLLGVFVRRNARNKDVLYFQGQSTEIDGSRYMIGPKENSFRTLNVEMQYGAMGYFHLKSLILGFKAYYHDTLNWNYRERVDVTNIRVEFNLTWQP